jgi:hypothetical protein
VPDQAFLPTYSPNIPYDTFTWGNSPARLILQKREIMSVQRITLFNNTNHLCFVFFNQQSRLSFLLVGVFLNYQEFSICVIMSGNTIFLAL